MVSQKRKKILKAKIENSWGKLKTDNFNFSLIESYFAKKDHAENLQTINKRIIDDIDLYDIFMFIDRTNSKIGQLFYFDNLLSLNFNREKILEREKFIDYLIQNKEERINIQLLLSNLNNNDAYYIPDLFLADVLSKPKYFLIIKSLSIVSLLLFTLTFFYDFLFFLLIPMLIANMATHYWNKRNIYMYMYSIPQLISLVECSDMLMKFKAPFVADRNKVLEAIKSISDLKKQMFVFKMELNLTSSELYSIIQLIIEYVKILFVLEPLIVFNVLSKLKNRKTEIQTLFTFIGEVDTCISIANLRSGASYYCIPDISKENRSIKFTDIYHPLIENCVSNSLSISNEKSILLTGSNMSGKTTFIRTVALNSLLAQTINTCFAHGFSMYPLRIFTGINMTDSLSENKSYYLQEVQLLKTMIDASSQTECANFYFLDELFRGTNTRERISGGAAVLSYLTKGNNLVLVSTHDIELTELLASQYELYHFTEVINDDNICFDYKIKGGKLDTFNAIRILEINHYPEEISLTAKSIYLKL